MKLKGIVFLAFFLVGLFPLASSIVFNLPKVLAALEKSGEDRLLYELGERFVPLRLALEKHREGIRLFAMLPGVLNLAEVEADAPEEGQPLAPEQLRGRMLSVAKRYFDSRDELLDIAILDGEGRERFRMSRAEGGGFVAAAEESLRDRRADGFYAEGLVAHPGTVFLSSSSPVVENPPDSSSGRVLVHLVTPLVSSAGATRGLLVFAIDLRRVLPGLAGFDLVNQDGECLIAGTHHDRQIVRGSSHVFADFSQFAKHLDTDQPLILRHASGQAYGWLPLFGEDPVSRRRLWVGQPVDYSLRDVWLGKFKQNIAIIGGVLVMLVAFLALLLARFVDRFRQRFTEGVAGILNGDTAPALGWRWPEELARLGRDLDRLAETHLANVAARREVERLLAHEMAIREEMVELSAQLLGSSCALGAVAERVNEAAKRLTGSAHGFVGTIDPGSRSLVIHTLSSMMGDSCRLRDGSRKAEFPIGGGDSYPALWGVALNQKKGFFTNAPSSHPASIGAPEGHVSLDRYLAVPVLLADELVGLIAVANADHDYAEPDLMALERLASHFAQAIKGIRLGGERDRLQVDLQQAQKMEAIGTLAGGVAHDFNNMLTPILGYTDLAMARLPADDRLRHDLAEIRKAADRARSLVRQILAFSRQKPQEVIALDPVPLLKETMKLLRSSLPATVEFRMEIQPDCGQIMADPTQMQQVFINLCTNAAHAMEEHGGLLGVGLDSIAITGGGSQEEFKTLATGRYLRLTVSDTGCGMERAVLERIFEPYFTTKEQGKGTGMGLALVHGIVKSHGGHIAVESELGKGSVFRVYLPLIAQASAAGGAGVVAVSLPRGSERVLLVDDDEQVVSMHQEMISFLGYQVTAVTDGATACQLFEANPDAFDLVVTDQTMPGMTGAVLAERLLAIRPRLPIVVCTGFSEAFTEEKAREVGIKGYVMKPVVISELAATLRRALDNGGSGA
ncbi:MAG: ATP-binding protein [Thermodesulfobacteriota bacterium]